MNQRNNNPAQAQLTQLQPQTRTTMPNINEMKSSKYLKQEDVGTGKLLTITECTQQNVAKENDPKEMKWCLYFEEEEKPLILNASNIELCAMATGEQNSDNWAGHKVVLFTDPTVMYAGKRTGGVRIRAAKNQAKPAPAQAASDAAEADIPF